MSLLPAERRIVFLVGAVQFINILDFMMVMPLGPDFARALHIAQSDLGYVGGAYTAAAAAAGLLGSFFLDRFDRRPALAVAMLGLVLGTAAGGFAVGLGSLMAARVVAGAFGGPATSLSLSIVADAIPPERRGKALGAVMSAFSVASVLGVPAGLQLSIWGGWRVPFFSVAGLGVVITLASVFALPSLRGHLAQGPSPALAQLRSLLGRRTVQLSLLMTATTMLAGFILIPNLPSYIQINLHYPRNAYGLLYMFGGAASFVVVQLVGRLVDRFGSFRVGTGGTVALAAVTYIYFIAFPPWLPVAVPFVLFMISMGFRNVAYNTLTSKVPASAERARFMSIQSAVQHLASAVGAFLAARLLGELPDHSLVGMPRIAWIAIVLALTLPSLLWAVERRVVVG
jgi:predicted MFS family arabinose efflux permease